MTFTSVTERGYMTGRTLRALAAVGVAGALLGAAGCDSPAGFAGLTKDPQDIFWRLELNQHAINLATDQSRPEYYTYQLVATPRRLDGSAMQDIGTVTWTTSDTNRVKVDATGKLLAKATTPTSTPVRIIATLTGGPGPVTNADTAFVAVTTTARAVATFALQPQRTTYGIGWDTMIVANVRNDANAAITGLRIHYTSSDVKVANYTVAGLFQPFTKGDVTLRASMAAYGQELEDAVDLTVGDQEVFQVDIGYFVRGDGSTDTFFNPEVVRIKAGQGVAWSSKNGIGANIQFTNAANVGPSPADGARGNPGSIFVFPPTRVIRTFAVPGTYEYRDANAGKTGKGTIIVEP